MERLKTAGPNESLPPGIVKIKTSQDLQIIVFEPPGTFAIRFRNGAGSEQKGSFEPWHLAWGDDKFVQAEPEEQEQYSGIISEYGWLGVG